MKKSIFGLNAFFSIIENSGATPSLIKFELGFPVLPSPFEIHIPWKSWGGANLHVFVSEVGSDPLNGPKTIPKEQF